MRCAPCRARAVARGVRLGRKPKLTGHQRKEAIARREAGEVLTDIARSYNVSHSTISRLHQANLIRSLPAVRGSGAAGASALFALHYCASLTPASRMTLPHFAPSDLTWSSSAA